MVGLNTFAHVPTRLIALRERAAACDGCSVPETCVKGLSQSQYEARAVRRSFGVNPQSARPRKLFCTSLVGNDHDDPGNAATEVRMVLGSFSRSSDRKKCALSLISGPPMAPPSCWFAYGSTRLAMKSFAFHLSSRK